MNQIIVKMNCYTLNCHEKFFLSSVYSLFWKLHRFVLDLVVQRNYVLIIKRTLKAEESTTWINLLCCCWTLGVSCVSGELTFPKTKQYSVTPIAHTSKACGTNTMTVTSVVSDSGSEKGQNPPQKSAHLSAKELKVLSHCLRGHEGRRSCCGGEEVISPLKFITNTKVCNFEVTVVPQ